MLQVRNHNTRYAALYPIRIVCWTTPQKSEETRGNAITQPQSHPIKNVEFRDGMGWDCKTRPTNAFHKEVSHLVHLVVFLTNTFPNREFP